MVRETSHTGVTNKGLDPTQVGQGAGAEGAAGGIHGEDEPPRYPDVYESRRIIEDWELMTVANFLQQQSFLTWLTVMRELTTREVADNISHNHKARDSQGVFEAFLSWKERMRGLAYVGQIAQALKKHGYQDLAESFPP